MCTTRTYTRQHAEADTSRYLCALRLDGIGPAELAGCKAYALQQQDEWPDGVACTEHAKAG
jgi:hypothetical protein